MSVAGDVLADSLKRSMLVHALTKHLNPQCQRMKMEKEDFAILQKYEWGKSRQAHEIDPSFMAQVKDAVHRSLFPSRTAAWNPTTGWFMMWETTILVCLFYTAIVTPFSVAFLHDTDIDETSSVLSGFNLFIDVCFICDIIIKFNVRASAPSTLSFKPNSRT